MLIWLIGFIPAILVFIVAYMSLGFGEPVPRSLFYGVAVAVACWALFDRGMHVPWPASLLGDVVPALRTATGFL